MSVSFDGNELRLNTSQDAEIICRELKNKEVEILILQGNTLGIEAAERVGLELSRHTELTEAHFKDLFTSRGRDEVPEALRHLLRGISNSGAQLTLLDLSDNAIGPIGAPSVIEFLETSAAKTLERLYLQNCGLGPEGSTSIAAKISQLKRLRELRCGRNRLENKGATNMSMALSELNTLEVLVINQNGIHVKGITQLVNALLANVDTIRTVDFSDNTVKAEGCNALANAIIKSKKLKELKLDDALVENEGFTIICDALSKSPCLHAIETVSFEGNELGGQKLVDLIESTFSCRDGNLCLNLLENEFSPSETARLNSLSSKFEILLDDILSDEDEEEDDELESILLSTIDKLNNITTTVSFDGNELRLNTSQDAEIICRELKNKEVEILILQGNTLGIEAAERVGLELSRHTELTEAHFKDLFTSRGRDEVPEALRHLLRGISNSGAQLTLLDLSDNAIGPIGAPSVIEFLETSAAKTLERLYLQNCGLGPEGSTSIAAKISQLKRLRELRCGRNRLENKGATNMSMALSELNTLEVLVINQNGIHVKGITQLVNALLANVDTIRTVDFSDNTVKAEGCNALANAIIKSKKLKELKLDDALVENEGFTIICDALSKSPCLHAIETVSFEGNELGGQKLVDLIESTFSCRDGNLCLNLLENEFSPSETARLNCSSSKFEILLDDILSDDEEEEGRLDSLTEKFAENLNFRFDIQRSKK